MRKTKRDEPPEDLLPWHLNGTLRGEEKRRVEEWLQNDPRAAEEARAWRLVQAAVQEGEPIQPPSQVWERLIGEIRTALPRRGRSLSIQWTQVLSCALALILLAGLWLLVKPGVVIRWRLAAASELPEAFRVYRGLAGEEDFRLLGEIPTRMDARQYEYSDVWAIPGREYVYRIEAVSAQGTVTISESRRSSPWVALPWQLAVLAVSLVMGYAAAGFLEWLQAVRRPIGEVGAS